MRTRPLVLGVSLIVTPVVAVACGGGGPGVQGPEAQSLFFAYSGTWLLDVEASDVVPARGLQGARGDGGRGGGGGDPLGDVRGRGRVAPAAGLEELSQGPQNAPPLRRKPAADLG